MRFMASRRRRRDLRGARAARRRERPAVRWRYVHDEPWFDNQVATLELDGRRARVRAREDACRRTDGDDPALARARLRARSRLHARARLNSQRAATVRSRS